MRPELSLIFEFCVILFTIQVGGNPDPAALKQAIAASLNAPVSDVKVTPNAAGGNDITFAVSVFM